MDKHPIDKLFGENMSQREWQFSNENWQEALALIKAEKRRKRKVAIWWIAGVAFVIILLSGLYILKNAEEKTDIAQVAAQKSQVETDREASIPESQTGSSTVIPVEDIVPASADDEIVTSQTETLHNPIASSQIVETKLNKESSVTGPVAANDLLPENAGYNDNTPVSSKMSSLATLPVLSVFLDHENIEKENFVIPEWTTDRVIIPLRSSMISGWTLHLAGDMIPGVFSRDNRFADMALRLGYQSALHRNFALELRGGLRYFNGVLPVHSQVNQVEYAIGAEITSFQLQAEHLLMAGMGIGLQFGAGSHRLGLSYDIDRVVAAYGVLREQFFVQERKLQDRNAKPILRSEEDSWLSTNGLNKWQHSGIVAYRFAINPKTELGLAWAHRFNSFVDNEDIPRDRMSFTIKKIF